MMNQTETIITDYINYYTTINVEREMMKEIMKEYIKKIKGEKKDG